MSGPLDTTVSGPEMLSVSVSFVALVGEKNGRGGSESLDASGWENASQSEITPSPPFPQERGRRGWHSVPAVSLPWAKVLCPRGADYCEYRQKAAGAKTCRGVGGEVSLMAGWLNLNGSLGFPGGKAGVLPVS